MSFSLQIVKNGKARRRGDLSYNLRFWATLLEALEGAGLIDRAAEPGEAAPWPPKGLRLSEERADALLCFAQIGERPEPAPTVAELAAVEAYRVAHARWRRGRAGKGGRVPRYKLVSNDAWLVTAKEAKRIADGLERYLGGDDFHLFCDARDWNREDCRTFRKELAKFSRFCTRAAAAEGFEVG